jgi:hypothetical protein
MVDERTLPSRAFLMLLAVAACTGRFDGRRNADPGMETGGSSGDEGGSGGTGGDGDGGSGGSGGSGLAVDAGALLSGRDGGIAAGCVGGVVPAAIQSLLKVRCQLCHGNPPLAGVPGSLVTPDDFMRVTKADPTKTMAELSIARVTTTMVLQRMPPAPATPLSATEVQTLRAWIEGGMRLEGCSSDPGALPADAGPPPDAGPDPFAVAPRCTSGTTWTRGNAESPLMQPGVACIACHAKSGEAPRFAFGGTLYPSGHEPDQCNGADGTGSAQGAMVVVLDSAGVSATANVNAAGNFYASARVTLKPPLKAKVVYMGRERLMIGAVPSGDCNTCHTQKGTTTVTTMGAVPAPGRILLP